MLNKPLRVLIVEDSEDDADLLVRALRAGGYDPTFERVETFHAMRQALHQPPGEAWDVVIADYSMPQLSGLGALGVLKEQQLDVPFIMLSGILDEQSAGRVLQAGAHAFIPKSDLTRLISVIEREIGTAKRRATARVFKAAMP